MHLPLSARGIVLLRGFKGAVCQPSKPAKGLPAAPMRHSGRGKLKAAICQPSKLNKGFPAASIRHSGLADLFCSFHKCLSPWSPATTIKLFASLSAASKANPLILNWKQDSQPSNAHRKGLYFSGMCWSSEEAGSFGFSLFSQEIGNRMRQLHLCRL